MFELTNEQRKCFALPPVSEAWTRIEVKPHPCDMCYTFAYLDGNRVARVIRVLDEQEGHEFYQELAIDAELNDERTMLLPKTAKGKPVQLTASNLLRRTPVGMGLSYKQSYITIDNYSSNQTFYHTGYDDTVRIKGFAMFEQWVKDWCRETDEKQYQRIQSFSMRKRCHQKYREGDFFRFRISRTLYGYGRILLDYSRMRKAGIEFWDIFMGKPLCVAVYHIATENDRLLPDELVRLNRLPSHMIMDDALFYGDFTIIGHLPLTESEKDYPIHYGDSITTGESCVCYQQGEDFIRLPDAKQLYPGFRSSGIGWHLLLRLSVLKSCIACGSNEPYWQADFDYRIKDDLRNPIHRAALERIRAQVGLTCGAAPSAE